MINAYEIKKINGEEILYLYLDYRFEFANFDLPKDRINFIDKINKFIIDNNIHFKGSIISIVVSGILAGNLIINRPTINNEIDDNVFPKVVNVDKLMSIPKIELPKEIVKPKETEIQETKKIDINTNVKKSTINSNNNVYNNQKVETNVEKSKETSQKEVIDTNTYVKVKRKNGTVETIELEEYLIGVVGAEMPALFNIEALKAQSIVARTYTLKAISSGKTLTDTESTQSYKDNTELKSLWGSNYNSYYNKIKSAVLDTKGMYLTYNGNYIEAVYHSTSNGKTEDSKNVWSNSYPYLISVDSPYDSLNPSFLYEVNISYNDLSSKLGINIDSNTDFNILEKTVGDRVSSIQINNKIYRGIEFRNILGLRSADFEIEKMDNYIKVKTKGYGHGVGMSQYGANGFAKHGYSYSDILKHYYRGVTISKK